jgi:hypothetical protein
MLFAEKAAKEEIRSVLADNGFLVFEPTELKGSFLYDVNIGTQRKAGERKDTSM